MTAVPLTALRRHRLLTLLGLALLTLGVTVASIAIGAMQVPLTGVWRAITHPTGTEQDVVVRSLRLPRTAFGVLAGTALGVAGALVQGHTRNPLADPGLLGVTQGAAFAMVLSIFTLGTTDLRVYIWFGFLGSLVASIAVFTLGSVGGGGGTPITLALAGAAVSTLLHGLISGIVLLDQQALNVYRFWQAGAIAGRDSRLLPQVLPFVLLGLVLALANAPGLNALALGEDVARSLGRRVGLTRALGIAAITLLTGSAVAVCGALAFVGLIVPHLARALSGPDHRWLLPYSGLLGAILLLGADIAGRMVARPGELEVGIMLALIGGPFFVALVRRRKPVRL
ncbi:FecCD family ABC transporter permease [Actinomadura sp. HBU206391]|uniref:FecCD family ABC transporter permease n=1 Tax=Actinomadura sp. HBU206391 TaxID=2731692 RepID=UPI00164F331E|nr:iron ABC transporter permease [Actinomadura sp. HBU206391]MBC6459485.1 iron ABC transporter permease [Actinomadura sp. HBU206391]